MLPGSHSCGMDVQVFTQPVRAGASARATAGVSTPVAARPRNERLRIFHTFRKTTPKDQPIGARK
jgi:hypothetical protein